MQARVITIKGNHLSETGAGVLRESSALFENEFDIKTFDAITADESNKLFTREGLRWTYPWEGQQSDIATGLKLSAYSGADPRKRVACFMSHYRLWKEAAKSSENYLILEHDAIFTNKLVDPGEAEPGYDCVLGINDPRGATRRAALFHYIIQKNDKVIQQLPKIDTWDVPQGLAGNSAYIITPSAAKKVIETVNRIGAWPNDALLCYQNFNFLRVTKQYYTRVQGLPSTTTL